MPTASVKRLLNRSEAVVHDRLVETCKTHGARVCPKVRVADVLQVEGVGVLPSDLSFALKAHFDFVVIDNQDMPLFAVEFDGPTHSDPVQHRRDRTKDGLCEKLGLPILRVRDAHLQVFRTYDLLSWIVEQWFLQVWFDDAQAKGHIAGDEVFDPALILGRKGEPAFPMWLSLDAQNELRRLRTEGRIFDGYPSFTIGIDDEGAYRGLFWLEVVQNRFVSVMTGARAQNFPVSLGDLLTHVGIIKLFEATEQYLAGSEPGISEAEMAERIRRSSQLTLARASSHTRTAEKLPS